MNNYQLYRTNTRLGGQVAWNLVLGDEDGRLCVDYFDVTPISPYVKYKYGQNRECIRYSHAENVRELYNEIKGQFYDDCINPKLKTIYPILLNVDELGEAIDEETRDSSLEFGCSRISYKRYNKQFQLFCPMWLEDLSSSTGIQDIKFTIEVYNQVKNGDEYEDSVLASKSLCISVNSRDDDPEYHKLFCQYWSNYLNEISNGGVIGDDVANINITEEYATINGLDISSGKIITRDISNLIPNLYDRERPWIETDYMIIDNFHTSTMICKQLFNFNLVFNIEDLMNSFTISLLRDSSFKVRVNTYVGDKLLSKKFFDCDYEEDGAYKSILSYLRDYNNVDFCHENKLEPNICHWTLCDNLDYLFNLYPGFATEFETFYKNSPDYWDINPGSMLEDKSFDKSGHPNVLTWCYDVTNPKSNKNVEDIINSINENNIYTTFNINKSFFGYTRYDNEKVKDILSSEPEPHPIIQADIAYMEDLNDDLVSTIRHLESKTKRVGNWLIISVKDIDAVPDTIEDDEISFYNYNDISNPAEINKIKNFIIISQYLYEQTYIIFTQEKFIKLLSFKWMKRIAEEMIKQQDMFGYIPTFKYIAYSLANTIEPRVVYLFNSLKYQLANSPWTSSREIEYVKDNNNSSIVIRYDGKIKPAFTTYDKPKVYQVKSMTKDEFTKDSVWSLSNTRGFLPSYPSVNYFNLEKVGEDDDNFKKLNEYKWFEECVVFNLMNSINEKIYSKDIEEDYYNNDYLIDKVIREKYPYLSTKYFNYIKSLYDCSVNYEYDNPAYNEEKHKFNYIYIVKLNLR